MTPVAPLTDTKLIGALDTPFGVDYNHTASLLSCSVVTANIRDFPDEGVTVSPPPDVPVAKAVQPPTKRTRRPVPDDNLSA